MEDSRPPQSGLGVPSGARCSLGLRRPRMHVLLRVSALLAQTPPSQGAFSWGPSMASHPSPPYWKACRHFSPL